MHIYICHRHRKGFRKEKTRFRISIIFGIFGMDAGRYADELWQFVHACAVVFATKIMEQMIVTSSYDVTRFSHVMEGGNYKRRM